MNKLYHSFQKTSRGEVKRGDTVTVIAENDVIAVK